ncbi:hypothetical protein O163_12155 [Caldanaerobacter subterraneus subsp. yonseiensis KB-1]|uniref:Uncharacterized protein n=1 Tax=Caldanaerobacter subterraneus subsp. yonseiensis KB-1 TaxID=1388761 RepID=U5CMY3_CALSX|nr:hypothetical protein O163_12155 [Caldanaerobacter subterraneus subsp. yonseiensis KB-1]
MKCYRNTAGERQLLEKNGKIEIFYDSKAITAHYKHKCFVTFCLISVKIDIIMK